MVFLTLVKLTLKSALYLTVFGIILVFLPGFPPHVKIESFTPTPGLKLEGVLLPNGILDKAELVLNGQVTGPESVAGDPKSDGETVFTGVEGGQIVKVENSKVTVVAQTGTNKAQCQGHWELESCGRPLGIRFINGFLFTADATRGVVRVDPKTGDVQPLYSVQEPIEGVAPKFTNDFDLAQDGRVFWSEPSTLFDLKDSFVEMLSSEYSGRLVMFDPKEKKSKVLIRNIHFANGVQLSPREDFVLVSETIQARVRRYYLKGPKAGTSDIFIDGLPGLPDNIRASGKDTFYIALIAPRSLIDHLAPLGWLRKLVLRLREVILLAFTPVDFFLPNYPLVQDFKFSVATMRCFPKPKESPIILEVDEHGKILRSFQSLSKKVTEISQFSIVGKYAYMGSPTSQELWRIETKYLK